MSAAQLTTRPAHVASPIALVAITAVFTVGVALGAAGTWIATPHAQAAPVAAVPAPALDTSAPYLTVQHGIVVEPAR